MGKKNEEEWGKWRSRPHESWGREEEEENGETQMREPIVSPGRSRKRKKKEGNGWEEIVEEENEKPK